MMMFGPFLVLLIPLGLVAGAFVLAFRFLRAYETRDGGGGALPSLTERVRELESRQADLVRELADLEDRQRFLTDLLGGHEKVRALKAPPADDASRDRASPDAG